MHESIRGTLLRKEPSWVVVEAAGIGWRIEVALPTYEALPRVGQEVRLLLHPVVRPEEWRLYGFAEESLRAAFRALLKVAGVGPVVALAVIGTLGPAGLQRALEEGDLKALQRVKGVGRKTGERILVELKGTAGLAGSGPGPGVPQEGPAAEAVRALENLGYDPAEARRRIAAAVAAAGGEGSPPDAAQLLRRALRGE